MENEQNKTNENKETDFRKQFETERREYGELLSLLVNVQNDYTRSNKVKDFIIMLLIVLMFLEACAGYAGFLWWESQWEYEETVTTTTVDMSSEGDNANAEYNDVDYNDNAVHNEN